MIAPTWRGWTRTADADDYVGYLQETVTTWFGPPTAR